MGGEVRADTAQYSFKVAGQVFQVLSCNGYEEMSQLFRFGLTLWSDDPQIDIEGLVRQDGTITISWGANEKEYHGIVAACSQTRAGKPGLGGVEKEWGEYSVELVPTLWLLGHTRSCRIFQNMGADKIIKKVLDASKMAGKYDFKASACPEREYCVQYRETDLAFISRLMEEEGIFYYFTHDGQEKMVLGDSTGHYGTCDPESKVEYKTPSGELSRTAEYISELTYEESAFPGKVKLKDFNYREPTKALKVEETAEKNTDLEIYDYHLERYRDDGRGRALAKVMVKAHEARKKVISAQGTWRSASCGCKVTVSKAYRDDLNGDWVVVATNLSASQDAEGGVDYSMGWEAVQASVVFRPLPVTPQPALNPQTATVVGPPGEQIYMDQNGRAKVQFHWDLDGKKDENSSCWIRVAQPFAGLDEETQKKHGFQWHPQIGDEVVVDFLEGDPDNPLIVGSVFNNVNMQPIKPEELIRQVILTRYQHRLLMDDKNTTITMNTGGSETLTMVDKKEGEGKIRLSTVGDQVIHMEDRNPDWNNVVLLRTSQAHQHQIVMSDAADKDVISLRTCSSHVVMLSDTDKSILVCTAEGHFIKLDDPSRSILLETVGKHKIVMDDIKQNIKITSKGGGRIEISDVGQFIEMASPTNKQKLRVDYSGTGLKLEAVEGDIELLAPCGKIRLESKDLEVKVTRNADIDITQNETKIVSGDSTTRVTGSYTLEAALGVTIKAGGSYSLEATSISEKATVTFSIEGMMVDIKATAMCTITSPFITSSADAVNTLRGGLVLIN